MNRKKEYQLDAIKVLRGDCGLVDTQLGCGSYEFFYFDRRVALAVSCIPADGN